MFAPGSHSIHVFLFVLNLMNNLLPGKSTLFKILDECSASVRKSIEGLDNYIMEGCRGFSCLESILDQLGICDEEFSRCKEGLQKGKRYLKSEFKVLHFCLISILLSKEEPIPKEHRTSYFNGVMSLFRQKNVLFNIYIPSAFP